MSAFRANVGPVVVTKFGRNLWAASSPINVFFTYHNPVGLRVISDVRDVAGAIGEAVMGIHLLPRLPMWLKVDVVPECLLFATSQVGLLLLKPWVIPVFIERHSRADPHGKDQPAGAFSACCARADHPIADLCLRANFRFARRERTEFHEGVRRKPKIARYDIRIEIHPLSTAAIAVDPAWCALASVRVFPLTGLSGDRVYDTITVPSYHGIRVVFQRLWELAVIVAMPPYTNDALALLLRVLDLPVYPLAVLRLWRDVNNENACPIDLRRQDLRFNIVGCLCVVFLARMDRGVANMQALTFEQIFQLPEACVILVHVANENVRDVLVAHHEALEKAV